jgi:hypothetical protein
MGRARFPKTSAKLESGKMARHLGQIAQGTVAPVPPGGPRVIAEDFYTYGIQFQNFNSGDTATGFIQIEADSDFLIQKLAYFSNFDNSQVTVQTQDVPLATILIVDTGSGRQIMNIPIPIGALFGDGRLPYILPTPKLFTKNSRINVTVFNFGGEDYDDLWINFEGKKIFTTG